MSELSNALSGDFLPRFLGGMTLNFDVEVTEIRDATAEELAGIKGIGPKTAAKIVEWRTKNGNFQSVEQFKGIFPVDDSSLMEV